MGAEGQPKAHKTRAVFAFVLGLLMLPVVAFGVDALRFRGRVFRGVRAGALPLAGLGEAAVRDAVQKHAEALALETIVVEVGEARVTLPLRELGLRIDVDATVSRALAARREPGLGRIRGWVKSLTGEHDVGVAATIDEGSLEPLFERWEREHVPSPFEGAVVVEGGEPVVAAPKVGQAIDRPLALREAQRFVTSQELAVGGSPRSLRLPLIERPARRSREHVEAALGRAKEIVAGSIALYVDRRELASSDEAPAERLAPARAPSSNDDVADERITVLFSREQLLAALKSRLVDEPLGVTPFLDPAALDPMLGDLRKAVEEPSVEPHFEIDRVERPFVVPGRAGRVIKADAVAAALEAASASPERAGKLPIVPGAAPTTTVAELERLGVARLVAEFTTSHPCCMPRVDNIHRVADLIDGVVVKPGDTFSINLHVGERTVEKGFKAAPTIVNGEMEDTIGGGISQFATTLFNAAFYGGYDIVERKPHSFYISRYPMGHEATLAFPKPDLVIRNDTNAGLLIRCLYTKTSITVKLYGDNGGRRVRRKVSQVRDIVQPPVEYLGDDRLEPDEEKVVDRGQVGWTVTVSRLIDFPDAPTRVEERKVVYQPRYRRVRVHSCKIPAGHKGWTGAKCPESDTDEHEAPDAPEAPADVPREGDARPDEPVEDEG